MSYCQLSDVQAMLAGMNITLSTTSNVTSDQVTSEIIPMYDRYIDDRLGQYYVTPITGTNALLTMNRIEKLLCAAEVAERIYVGQAPSESPAGTDWRKQAEDMLTRLTTGDPVAAKNGASNRGIVILTDATPTGDTPEPISAQITDNLSSPLRQTPPAFSMGMQF